MATPVFLVIREFTSLIISIGIMIITSVILKLNWWNKLDASYGEKDSDLKIEVEEEPSLVVEK